MLPYIKSENLKTKHTKIIKLMILSPLITMALSYFLTYGMKNEYYFMNSYNWWYMMILPAALTLLCASVGQKDERMGNRAVLTLPLDLKKVWFSKIMVCLELLIVSSLILFIGVTLRISTDIGLDFLAIILLIISFSWQIPVCLFLSCKIGLFGTFLLNTAFNMLFSVLFSVKNIWWAFPYSYPGRLMCPVLNILPNGLPAKEGSKLFTPALLSYQVVAPGIVVSFLLLVVFTYATANWYAHREVN